MSFFEDVFDKLFPKKEPAQAEIIHETLERTERELANYSTWEQSPEQEQLLADVYNAYHLKKKGIVTEMNVHLLETKYSNGFAITFPENIKKDISRNLFDYFKEKTLQFQYRLAQKDRRIMDRETYEEVIEKWYLKPNGEAREKKKSNQLYGNILIEYVMIDRKPSFMKLMANVYQDRLYSKALPFDEFVEKLFETNYNRNL